MSCRRPCPAILSSPGHGAESSRGRRIGHRAHPRGVRVVGDSVRSRATGGRSVTQGPKRGTDPIDSRGVHRPDPTLASAVEYCSTGSGYGAWRETTPRNRECSVRNIHPPRGSCPMPRERASEVPDATVLVYVSPAETRPMSEFCESPTTPERARELSDPTLSVCVPVAVRHLWEIYQRWLDSHPTRSPRAPARIDLVEVAPAQAVT